MVWLGVVLFTQMIAFDAGQSPIPFVVSNGRQSTMPSMLGVTNGHRCSYPFHSTPSTTGTANQFVDGGMVIELQWIGLQWIDAQRAVRLGFSGRAGCVRSW